VSDTEKRYTDDKGHELFFRSWSGTTGSQVVVPVGTTSSLAGKRRCFAN
jgi:hypothetical protein